MHYFLAELYCEAFKGKQPIYAKLNKIRTVIISTNTKTKSTTKSEAMVRWFNLENPGPRKGSVVQLGFGNLPALEASGREGLPTLDLGGWPGNPAGLRRVAQLQVGRFGVRGYLSPEVSKVLLVKRGRETETDE